jgi:hypothetical protein
MGLVQGAMKLRMTKAASLDIAVAVAVAIKAQTSLKTSGRFSIHPIALKAIAAVIVAESLTTALAVPQSASPSITPKARPLLPATASRRLAAA